MFFRRISRANCDLTFPGAKRAKKIFMTYLLRAHGLRRRVKSINGKLEEHTRHTRARKKEGRDGREKERDSKIIREMEELMEQLLSRLQFVAATSL